MQVARSVLVWSLSAGAREVKVNVARAFTGAGVFVAWMCLGGWEGAWVGIEFVNVCVSVGVGARAHDVYMRWMSNRYCEQPN